MISCPMKTKVTESVSDSEWGGRRGFNPVENTQGAVIDVPYGWMDVR